nr:hypothetical protein [Tanacetum cinerariifolium]
SDATLTRILEALAYRVKKFKIKRLNPGMNTCFWIQKDVTRSKEFIAAIERRLKTRRIYRNLECFNQEDDRDDLAEEADSGLQSHWDAVPQLFSTSDTSEEGMVQVGSGVAGLSSVGSGFHQPFLESAVGR